MRDQKNLNETEHPGKSLAGRIFSAGSGESFSDLALEVYRFQYEHCRVYREFADALYRDPIHVRHVEEIPFLPVEFFRSREVISEDLNPVAEFRSSGTTGTIPSRHLVADTSLYDASLSGSFRRFYGDPSAYTFLSLTPEPSHNSHSSLIRMIVRLMKESPGKHHGFFLKDHKSLSQRLIENCKKGEKTILIGLTYALLDFAEQHPGDFPGLILVETGGMKGRRREITRYELHEMLQHAFPSSAVHSEYGMTELLSQAWSGGDGLFNCPPWMKILVREVNDPLSYCQYGRTGGISVIDLANLYSCSFIATQDLGRLYEDGSFEVLGRFDSSDLRGCTLMLQD
jgi:hypothetical protein